MLSKSLVSTALLLLATSSAGAFDFNNVITLGDSLLDDLDGGRSPVAAEHVAERLGAPLTKFAQSGSTSAQLIADGQHTSAAAQFGSGDLAMLWIGGNDFFTNPLQVATGDSDFLDTLESNANTAMATLVANGLDVAVFNLPDMSQVPGVMAVVETFVLPFLRSSTYDNITRETVAWNNRLASLAQVHGATVIDVFGLFQELATDPSDFSLLGNTPILNADTGCQLCVFFDDFLAPDVHPASFAQGFVANEAIAALNQRYETLDLEPLSIVEIARLADIFAGDFDGNQSVDAADLTRWQSGFGTSGADADGDGDTDGADLLGWQRNLTSNLSGSLHTVPEPTTATLAILLILVPLISRPTNP